MKVSAQQVLINNSGQQTQETGNTSTAKNFHEMSAGDTFKAKIVDIQPNQVTLKLASGDTLTAKSLVLPDARIGDDSIFMVKENFKNQILLEMIRPSNNINQTNIIKEALSNAGLYATAENIDLVKALITAELPVDAQILQKAAFFHYSGSSGQSMDIDKVLFLLQEDFPMVQKSVEMLNGIMDKTVRLQDNLTGMIKSLLSMEDTETQKTLLNIVLNNISDSEPADTDKNTGLHLKLAADDTQAAKQNINDIKELLTELSKPENLPITHREAIMEKVRSTLRKLLFVEINKPDSLSNINDFYKTLHETTSKMLVSAQTANVKGDLINQLTNLKDGMEFMDHVSHYKEYLQIPFSIDGRENNGELFVFKDGKNSNKSYDQASILISLDFVNLGHVESYINKNGRVVNMQFRGDQDSSLKLISRHTNELTLALSDKGYVLSGLTVKKTDEVFTVVSNPEREKSAVPKRYTFDMRV